MKRKQRAMKVFHDKGIDDSNMENSDVGFSGNMGSGTQYGLVNDLMVQRKKLVKESERIAQKKAQKVSIRDLQHTGFVYYRNIIEKIF